MSFRLLIADDEPGILKFLRRELERDESLRICGEAMDGSQAVVKAQELRPDLIILDLAMPFMNGIDAARKIRTTLPKTPIILFTLTDFPEVRSQAAKAGIQGVVAKRDGIGSLQAAIESALSQIKKADSVIVSSDIATPNSSLEAASADAEGRTLAPAIDPKDVIPETS